MNKKIILILALLVVASGCTSRQQTTQKFVTIGAVDHNGSYETAFNNCEKRCDDEIDCRDYYPKRTYQESHCFNTPRIRECSDTQCICDC